MKNAQEKVDYTYLFRLLVDRDLKERYAGSWLGLSWSVIQPAALFFTYILVFSIILKVSPGRNYDGIPFPIWMLSGMVPWLFMAEVFSRSPNSVVNYSRIVTKNAFPNEFLPMVTVVSAMVNHVIALFLLALAMPFFGVETTGALIWLPAWLLGLVVFCFGMAYLASAVGVYFRDLGQLAPLAATVWSFGTPIFYPETMVPQNYSWMLTINPAALFVRGYRTAFLGRQPSSLQDLGLFWLWALGLLLVGLFVFKRFKRGFADVL